MQVRSATSCDGPDIARLCWAYRDFLLERTRHVPDIVDAYYDATGYAALIEDLPRIHQRPKGDILLIESEGKVSGCAMYYERATDTCEIKRIYLDPDLRGKGAARTLVETAIERAKADGHTRMVLDTIHTLKEAIALYERLGFKPCAPFYQPDPRFIDTLRFFDFDLKRSIA